MNQFNRTTIPNEDAEITVHHLEDTLAELIDLTFQAKQAHWNVTGPRFRAVHLQLDDLVGHTRRFLDTVAERAVTLGEPASGSLAAVAQRSKIDPLPISFIGGEEVVKLMAERLSGMAARLRGRISATQDRDPVTSDLFTTILGTLEEQMWMFHTQTM